MHDMPDKEANLGPAWEWLFKINQILLPAVVLWAAWATSSIYELKGQSDIGERFTAKDGINMELQIKDWVRDNYPPDDIKNDIKAIRSELEDIRLSLATHGLSTN